MFCEKLRGFSTICHARQYIVMTIPADRIAASPKARCKKRCSLLVEESFLWEAILMSGIYLIIFSLVAVGFAFML